MRIPQHRQVPLPFLLLLGAAAASLQPTPGLHDTDARRSSSRTPIALDGYGQFTGTEVNTSFSGAALPRAVDAWLGIEYAAQPVGTTGRFTAAGWPAPFSGVRAATAYGKKCIQDERVPLDAQDEACLTFNVYRTQGVPLDRKLPVLVYIHGGLFLIGGWDSFDGASFVARAPPALVAVTFHYRLSSFGSLPSRLFADRGLLNLGLRDQHFFLSQFVQRHIAAFGGDPAAVTIGGRSAGAHSVGFHYMHNYGEDADADADQPPYFARAIQHSGAATARGWPNATAPRYAAQYERFRAYLNCTADDDDAVLACLRAADVSAIRDVSLELYASSLDTLAYPFQPVQGGPLLEKSGTRSGLDGTFHRVPVLASSVTDEGSLDVPGTLETNDDFLSYLRGVAPGLTDDDAAQLGALYPDPSAIQDDDDDGGQESPYANSPNSTQFKRVSAAYGDYFVICAQQSAASLAASAGVAAWKVRFDTNDSLPAWQGVPHGADAPYTWGAPAPAVEHPRESAAYLAYLASFVATGDPNALRQPGTPLWPRYELPQSQQEEDPTAAAAAAAAPQQQLLLRNRGGVAVERDDVRSEACRFWRDPERALRLNK
ncbi:hypothetical protein SLS62_002120 [Diatrype stigma]|uniref:Carboxylic ester hydrolase n=1 Tax=Diatrype stigma TaxID=117547 RepID=A0AAN9UUX8_9PEZI